ncbi:MAG: peptidoglycan DD-metalloendopeptidase family protein [Verrucomicrobiae bacterium]|nr:peptidoglycan DD-metalloendopeptidase family protein [Verrucomicrobiae bacterium]
MAEIDSLLENIDNDKKEQFGNMENLGKIAEKYGANVKEYLFQKTKAIIENPDARVNQRWMCCYVLNHFDDERAVRVLEKALAGDSSSTVRGVAACALGSFQSKETRAAARTALEAAAGIEKNPDVLKWIRSSLDGPQCGDGDESSPPPSLSFPPKQDTFEPLPWPHQAPGLTSFEIGKLNREVWVINDFPLYQADTEGKMRYLHGGLDIVLENGTKIYAIKDGWVKSVSRSAVKIADIQGIEPSFGWSYAHLGNIQVKTGEFVKRGTYIGDIDFEGLAHLHLSKIFSEGAYWENWQFELPPNQHFTYQDTTPPVIKTPFCFFENNSEKMIQANANGKPILKGAVDIVVGMRDGGQFAHSKDNGFGDRLSPAKITYEICSRGMGGKTLSFRSFDFTQMIFKQGFFGNNNNSQLTRTIFIHTDIIDKTASGDKVFSYYIITNTPGDTIPREVTVEDADRAWNTAAADEKGNPLYPDGEYEIRVRAKDFKGNMSTASTTVLVQNKREIRTKP